MESDNIMRTEMRSNIAGYFLMTVLCSFQSLCCLCKILNEPQTSQNHPILNITRQLTIFKSPGFKASSGYTNIPVYYSAHQQGHRSTRPNKWNKKKRHQFTTKNKGLNNQSHYIYISDAFFLGGNSCIII